MSHRELEWMRRQPTTQLRELLRGLETSLEDLGDVRRRLGLQGAHGGQPAGVTRALHDAFVDYSLSIANEIGMTTFRPISDGAEWVDMPSGDRLSISAHSSGRAGEAWERAFPGFQNRTLNAIGNEDFVVLERRGAGRQLNSLNVSGRPVGATGSRFDLYMAEVVHTEGGSINRIEDYYDTASLLRSLGVIPDVSMGHDERTGVPAPLLHAAGFVRLESTMRRDGWPIVSGRSSVSIGSSHSPEAIANVRNCLGIHEAFIQHDPDRFDELIAKDAVWIDVPTGEVLNGAAAAAHHDHGNWQTAFPDSDAEVTNMISNEDWVCVQHRGFGTHTGPLLLGGKTYDPTGKSIDIRVLDIVQYRDGKAVLIRNYYDVGMMLVQLGIIPS